MIKCSSVCAFCPNPCYRGEIKENRGNKEKISPISPSEMQGISDAFDTPSSSETGLAVVENIGEYEVVRNIFGKEKVRKVK